MRRKGLECEVLFIMCLSIRIDNVQDEVSNIFDISVLAVLLNFSVNLRQKLILNVNSLVDS